jgi:hypothetical protein
MSNYQNAVLCQVVQSASAPVASKFPPYADRVKVTIQVGQDTHEIWENVPTVIQDWQRGESQFVAKNAKGFYMGLDKRRIQQEQPQAFQNVGVTYQASTPQAETRITPTYAPQPIHTPQAATITGSEYENQNREIVMYNKRLAQVYRNCFEAVQLAMQDKGLNVELEKDIATSLFIQTTRRFQL